MSQPYIGEIRLFGGNFAPVGWMFCEGQLLPISENDAIFNLIGTTYGGDGQSTFALPDLRGRVPVHQGTGFVIGQTGGTETVTLTTSQLPAHTHPVTATSTGASVTAASGNVPAVMSGVTTFAYGSDQPTTALAAGTVSPGDGGNQPHENLQPYLAVSFIISLFGVFPSQV